MNDNTMIFLGNHGFSIGNDLNSGTGYTPGCGIEQPAHLGTFFETLSVEE
jgi:hypothetical protein